MSLQKTMLAGRLVFLCLFVLTSWLSAQDMVPQFNADYNRFRYSDDETYFEYYITLQRSSLTYIPVDSIFRAQFTVKAEVTTGDSLVETKSWTSYNDADSLSSIDEGQSLPLISSFLLPDGIYKVRLTVVDEHSQKENTIEFPTEIVAFAGDSLMVSDIELASSVTRDTTKTPYYKNGYRVFAHPTALYGLSLPILYVYAEIYELKPSDSDTASTFSVQYKVYDADGQLQKEWAPRVRPTPGVSAVEVNALNVVTLLSGAYTLVMQVEDLNSGERTQSARRFYVYREADYAEGGDRFEKREAMPKEGSPGIDAGRYDSMSKAELDKEFEFCRYITSKEERKTWKRIKNVEGKREFLKKFWADRDQTPGTPANEYKREYLQRVQTANEDFKGTFKEGWRTDRGRILLLYGFPEERERFPFTTNSRAYEVWHYYSQEGGIRFVFVDRRGMGEMELVHSTARGELYDTEWTRFLVPSGSGTVGDTF
ncbi:GWxTD domain-containing protein [candidate division KSB1 bacterium]|nr:GWxTD domain-containing protein [candidate division KSB1 bacterium]